MVYVQETVGQKTSDAESTETAESKWLRRTWIIEVILVCLAISSVFFISEKDIKNPIYRWGYLLHVFPLTANAIYNHTFELSNSVKIPIFISVSIFICLCFDFSSLFIIQHTLIPSTTAVVTLMILQFLFILDSMILFLAIVTIHKRINPNTEVEDHVV
jgi:hypothetical protein